MVGGSPTKRVGSPQHQQHLMISIDTCVETGQRVTSPRSVEACLRTGIEPDELLPKRVDDFFEHNSKFPEIEKEAARLRFDHFEQLRQFKLEAIIKERDNIIREIEQGRVSPLHGGAGGFMPMSPPSGLLFTPSPKKPAGFASPTTPRQLRARSAGVVGSQRPNKTTYSNPSSPYDPSAAEAAAAAAATVVKLEEKRLERMKRRQQREIQGVIEMEAKMARVAQENARRTAEENRKKADYLKQLRDRRAQLMAQKHEKEMAKKIEEDKEAAERKLRAKQEAHKEKILLELEAQKYVARQKEAAQREMERNQKAEEFRKQTELLLQQQEEKVMQNRQKMLEKEHQVAINMELANQKRHEEALDRRDKAAHRIQQALMQNQMILLKRRKDFDIRQAQAAERAREIHKKAMNEIKERSNKQKKEEDFRQKRLEAARQFFTTRVSNIVMKRQEMENKLAQVYDQREKERLIGSVEKQLATDAKRQNVARIQRMEEYHRLQTIQKIASEDNRSRSIKIKKQALKEAKQKVALESLLRKHRIAEAVEQMRAKNKWESFLMEDGSSNGNFGASPASPNDPTSDNVIRKMSLTTTNNNDPLVGTSGSTGNKPSPNKNNRARHVRKGMSSTRSATEI